MTSKNSYWKLSKANMKRRIPYFVVSFLVCFVLMPVVTYFEVLTFQYDLISYNIEYVMDCIARELAIGNYIHDVVVILLAILLAVTGNAWNNSQKKNDFYRSLPVKENTRFIYIHLNSLIIFFISFGINLILSNIVVAGFGLYQGKLAVISLYSLMIHTLEFVAVYLLAVIAQYLTGNNVLAICGTFCLASAEIIYRMIAEVFKDMFYKTYINNINDYTEFFYKSITSPITGALRANRSISVKYHDYYLLSNYTDIWPGVIWTLVQIAVFGTLAFYIYKKRPAQAGNKNIIFDKTKPFIKGIIMIPVVAVWVILVLNNTNNSIAVAMVGAVIALIITHIILQFIIEGDFGAIKKGIISTAAAGLVIVFVVAFFNISGNRFDRYMPNLDDVESVGISSGYEYIYNYYEYDDVYSYIRSSQHFLDDVGLTDEAFIKNVVEIISKNIDNGTYRFEDEWTQREEYSYIDVSFNLRNGKKVQREYYIPLGDYSQIEKQLLDLDEYKHATNQLEFESNKKYLDEAKKINVVYYNYGYSAYDMCAVEDRNVQKELFDAISKDHNARTSEIYYNEVPLGTTEVSVVADSGMNVSFSFPLYASDVNTIAVYNKLGYEPHGLDRASISKVVITKYTADDYSTNVVELTPEDDLFQNVVDNVELNTGNYRYVMSRQFADYDIVIYNNSGDSTTGAVLRTSADIDALDALFK